MDSEEKKKMMSMLMMRKGSISNHVHDNHDSNGEDENKDKNDNKLQPF
jgi:hypothetical protein